MRDKQIVERFGAFGDVLVVAQSARKAAAAVIYDLGSDAWRRYRAPNVRAIDGAARQTATPPMRSPSTRRSKSAGLRNGRTRRRRSIEKLGLIRIASFHAF
jgi:hypothetical protein